MASYNDCKYYALTKADIHLLKTHSIRLNWQLTYVIISGDKTFRELITQNIPGDLPIVCFGEWLQGPVLMTFHNTGKCRKYSEIDLFRFKLEHFRYNINSIIVDTENIESSDRTILYSKMP
jgi:hypothetical protein